MTARWQDWMNWVLIAGYTLGVMLAYPRLRTMGMLP